MKYLKKFKTFEMAIIKPIENIGNLIDDLIEENPSTIEQANEISNKYNVDIVTYDQFINSVDDEMRKGAPPKDRFMFGPPSGLHFAVMNKFTNKMNLVVDYRDFMNFITRISPPQLKKVIKSILGHESIHFQQFDRVGGDKGKYVVDSPKDNEKGYLSHHTEIMAHAFSIVDELKNVENKSKKEILQIIKKGRGGHRLLDKYYSEFWRLENPDKSKRLTKSERDGRDVRVIRKLNKYLYQYVEELFKEEE